MKKHELAAAVELASGGKQTVLATAKGQATYMNVIPAFRLEEISPELGSGLHPAFIVGGVEKSEIYIATYQAVIRDGEALSLPGQDPATGINFDVARSACLEAGEGFHLMTNWEWAAIALWCAKNGFADLHGNTDYGKSHQDSSETGKITKYGRTITGSGPDVWRHDGTPFGIADLVGNIWEWNDGLKLVDGKIIMPADNNYLLPESEWPEVGALIDLPNCEVQISDVITERDYDGTYFRNVTVKDGYTPPAALQQALIVPVARITLPGRFWAENNTRFEALPFRGGHWGYVDYAGLAALSLDCGRDFADDALGFRPAFIG